MGVDWSRGWSARWHVREVDKGTWADAKEVACVTSVDVERSCDGDAPVLESATIQLDAQPGTTWRERYMRVSVVAEQDGARDRADVATLLCSSTSGTVRRSSDALSVTGRGVLWPASVAKVTRGTYIPKGWDVPTWVADLLRSTLAAPVQVAAGGFALASHHVVDAGTAVLAACWSALRAGGWRLSVRGDGTVVVGPTPKAPALALSRANARLLVPGVSHELDWSGVPNVYVAIEGASVATATNADPRSPTSTASRGYRHDVVDTSPMRTSGETLEGYARRRLAEMSVADDVREYSREWWPGVGPGDLVRASLPSVGLEGDLRVVSQRLACGRGILVTERAKREVRSWPMT